MNEQQWSIYREHRRHDLPAAMALKLAKGQPVISTGEVQGYAPGRVHIVGIDWGAERERTIRYKVLAPPPGSIAAACTFEDETVL